MNQDENIKRFEGELKKVKREGMDELLNYVQTSDFYTAPTSTKYHLCCPGGLLQHSLNVLDALRSLLRENEDGSFSYMLSGQEIEKVSAENVIIMALFHDICKTRFYVETRRNKKVDGRWVEVPFYEIIDEAPLGHGEKSVIMLQSYIKLEKPELYAIRWHMGFPEGNDIYTFASAVEKYPIVWALHTADMLTSHIVEGDQENRAKFSTKAGEEK